ncbi:response regulator transcription factor [Dyadobacter tibetensis]|uniref:response regulator transcription factor n=1 Tax=Dyadobacter tibetensis TaxID=1211851 RepID=UPI0004705649|nr:response regulator transcription factor [Dyadobacter tibetensis]
MIQNPNSVAIIFEDHRMFADSFSLVLERLNIFESVHIFIDEKDLIRFFIENSSKKNIFLFIDYYIKDKHAIPLISEARRLNKRIKVIIVSSVIDPNVIKYIFLYSPEGFISKSSGFGEVVECIKDIQQGHIFTSPFISNIITETAETDPIPFTTRELEILQLFAQGLSIIEAAEKLFLSKHTIIAHRRHMMQKAKCSSIVELLAFSRKRGLI